MLVREELQSLINYSKCFAVSVTLFEHSDMFSFSHLIQIQVRKILDFYLDLTVCSTFTQPNDGDLVISENGTKASYSCAAGFTLSGDVQQMCGGQSSSGGRLEAPTCS
jgi:hypothetical protein